MSSSREPERRAQDFGERILQFLRRRFVFTFIVIGLSTLGFFTYRITTSFSEVEETLPSVAIAQVEGGRFLGLAVRDNTRDQFLKNPHLRMAMNEGFRAADSVRRHQMDEIWLQDGQHPETSDPAVLIVVKPKRYEAPDPPIEPVAIRRWKPAPEQVYDADELLDMQRSRPPVADDLEHLRAVWSGNRFAEVETLYRSMRRAIYILAVACAAILLAGIYRTFALVTTRTDTMEQRAGADRALSGFRAARERREAARRADS